MMVGSYLSLLVGLQAVKAAILLSGRVDDARSAKVLRIGINAGQRAPTKPGELEKQMEVLWNRSYD